MGETKTGQILVFLRKASQFVDNDSELGDQDIETVAEEDQVGVVGAVARSSTPVDDTSRSGGHLTKGVDVGHNIMSSTLFLLSSNFEFVVLDSQVSFHLLNTLVTNRKTEFWH